MSVRDETLSSPNAYAAEEGPEDLIIELDPQAVVQHTSRPAWAGDGVPREGDPLSDSITLEAEDLDTVLEKTRLAGRSVPVAGRLLWAAELLPVTGHLIPRGDSGDRGWLLTLRPQPDLPTRLLEASQGILMRAVEQMSFGVTLADGDGKIVYANRAEAEMHGYAPGELIGRFARELGASTTAAPPEVVHGMPWTRRRVNRRKDGSLFPIRLISDEIRDGQGRLLGRITITEDIAEAARLERMKEEFIRVASHELRTPLTSILTSLTLLDRKGPSSARWEEALAIAERNARHLLALVQDLLDFQNAIAGTLEIKRAPVPVADLLEEAAEEAAAGRSSRSAVLRSRIVATSGDSVQAGACVWADRGRLLQVLDQLISNALKFSLPSDPVRLHAVRGAERTTLMVTDQGPGVPRDVRRRLFEPFSQADSSMTRRDSGAGFGLALAKALVEAMDGELELIPEQGEPFGSTFLIHLPNA